MSSRWRRITVANWRIPCPSRRSTSTKSTENFIISTSRRRNTSIINFIRLYYRLCACLAARAFRYISSNSRPSRLESFSHFKTADFFQRAARESMPDSSYHYCNYRMAGRVARLQKSRHITSFSQITLNDAASRMNSQARRAFEDMQELLLRHY